MRPDPTTGGPDPWAVLGLRPGAPAEDVARAWRVLAARHHPDAGGDPGTFRRLTAARDDLLAAVGRPGLGPVLHRGGRLRVALRPLRRRIDRRRRPRVT